ncbi:hypothetical protein D3C75_1387070 [compost metagenome]
MNKSPDLELDFWSFLSEELTQVVNGKKTLDEATAAIQTETQTAADKVAKAQKAKKQNTKNH